MACKPGSVPQCWGDDYSSRPAVARALMQPTRTAHWKCCICRPYSVLLPVGFTLPPLLPDARCALTAPFHPYPLTLSHERAVCFLWHCPWGHPRRALPGTVFPWSPDFPLPCPKYRARQQPSGHLAKATWTVPAQGSRSPCTGGAD